MQFNEKYPELSFMLTFMDYQKYTVTEKNGTCKRGDIYKNVNDLEKELADLKKELGDIENHSHQTVEVIYLLGLGLGFHALEFLPSLKEKELIIVEDDLGILDAFLQMEHAEKIFSHPNVHVKVLLDPTDPNGIKNCLKECAKEFPSDQIKVYATEKFSKEKPQLEEILNRHHTISHSLHQEDLYHHQIFENLLPNYKRLSDAFLVNKLMGSCKGIPAIICGAGPSLNKQIPLLKLLEDNALLFAGGSTITALSKKGVIPHFSLAFDPNETEFERLSSHQAFQSPLIYGNRVHPSIFPLFNGPIGYLQSGTGGVSELWLEKELGLNVEDSLPDFGDEALSVTTQAISLATRMGCNPIIFVGMDLSFQENKRYAEGVLDDQSAHFEKLKQDFSSSEIMVEKESSSGENTLTNIKWLMESSVISDYIKDHPETTYINATEGGLGFADVKDLSLLESKEVYLKKSYDMRSFVHSLVMRATTKNFTKEDVANKLTSLQKSLSKCLELCNSVIDRGVSPLYELEFEEELAYRVLLLGQDRAIHKMLAKKMHALDDKCQDNKMDSTKFCLEKWHQFKEILSHYLTYDFSM